MSAQSIQGIVDALTKPVEFVAAIFLIVYFTRTLTAELVSNLNAVSAQILSFFVILMGFAMLISCKKYQIDTTIAGGVIGCGVNMLQNKVPGDLTPGSKSTQTTTVQTVIPPDPAPDNPPTPPATLPTTTK